MDTNSRTVPVIGFVGYSGSGKTTILVKIIAKLSAIGIHAAVVKHAHHQFDIDTPGKDSYLLRHAGAVQTIVASKHRWALMVETPNVEQEPVLADLIHQLDYNRLDLVLVEGFKHSSYPKIEIHRSELDKPLLYIGDPNIIALVTDLPPTAVIQERIPILDLNNADQIVQFIMSLSGIKNV